MSLPRVVIKTKDQRTYHTLNQQLQGYFSNNIEIINYSQEVDLSEADIILVSSNYFLEKELPAHKVLLARRTVDIGKMEELIKLPQGTKCLVVNNMLDTALETIEVIKNLGFDLEMYPYYPGLNQDYSKIDVAIVPSGLELVPREIKKVIDIGIRPLDFFTIVELSIRLNVPLAQKNFYADTYVKEIIGLSSRLFNTMNKINGLNNQLDTILNKVHDGIITINDDEQIIQINNAASKILGINLTDQSLLGTAIENIFPSLKLNTTLNEETNVYSLNGKKIVVNKTPITMNDNTIGSMLTFQDVTKIQQLEQELRKELEGKGFSPKYTENDIIGKSKKLQATLNIVRKIAKTEQTVLILGENGTGKELFAHSIHNLSNRSNGPFVPVNFAGLPSTLAESELFGYEDGAFTGAKKGGKPGLFEIAHNGTIFLDEIGDAPPSLQALLLRVLQEKQVMRVGGRRLLPINVRVIAATNKNLKEMVAEGKFRQDLFYRLFVLPVRIPALRERREDIPLLLEYFLAKYYSKKVKIIDEVMEKLINHNWPGNIREVESVVQYMISVMEDNVVHLHDLPEQFKEYAPAKSITNTDLIEELEKQGDLTQFHIILSCLEQAKNNYQSIGRGKIVQYAQELGTPLTDQQVRNRMQILRELGLINSGTKGRGSWITNVGVLTLNMLNKELL